jgi:hypothetical protein
VLRDGTAEKRSPKPWLFNDPADLQKRASPQDRRLWERVSLSLPKKMSNFLGLRGPPSALDRRSATGRVVPLEGESYKTLPLRALRARQWSPVGGAEKRRTRSPQTRYKSGVGPPARLLRSRLRPFSTRPPHLQHTLRGNLITGGLRSPLGIPGLLPFHRVLQCVRSPDISTSRPRKGVGCWGKKRSALSALGDRWAGGPPSFCVLLCFLGWGSRGEGLLPAPGGKRDRRVPCRSKC